MSALNRFSYGFREGMKDFALTLNVLISTILLLPVYIIGIGITSLVAKCAGKHFLLTASGKEQDSYWSALDAGKCSHDEYYKQF